MTETCILLKGNCVFPCPEPPKNPTPCTGWGRRPSSDRARQGFGPGRHSRTRKTLNSRFSLGQQADDVLLNLEGFHHGSVPSERLPVLVKQNLDRKTINVTSWCMSIGVFIISKRDLVNNLLKHQFCLSLL